MASDVSRPILSVADLRTFFFQDEGVVKAVDGATFEVHAGRTLGIVGESGCGKSVAARSILRIIDPPGRIVSGSVVYHPPDGVPVDLARVGPNSRDMRAIRGKEIALVFQEPMSSFSMHYTVGDQIVEAVRAHDRVLGKTQARARAVALLRDVGVPRPESTLDLYSFQLSGGLRQRAMIAMGLAGEPRVLIADEPTTALDVTTQAQILDLLRALQRRSRLTLILITHDMGVIAEMADDVAVMYLGRVVERGPVDQIFHAPRHPYTRALLRSIPRVTSEPRSRLPTIAGSVPHPFARPSGCPFHPRCQERIADVCDRSEPALVPMSAGEAVSCFLHHRRSIGPQPAEVSA